MAQAFNRCENIMLGHAAANEFRASTHLALLLSERLCKLKDFNPSDVLSEYLYLHHTSDCDVGKTTKLVYEELKSTITIASNNLKKKHFVFQLDKIHNASLTAHNKLKGLSGGCNPVQRSFPLALCPWIRDEDLFETTYKEAHLTHYHNVAGQVAGLVNLICRRLIKGDDWNVAIQNAFSSAPNLLGEIKEVQQCYATIPVLNSKLPPSYATNALHTSLYCVTQADSFENALTLAIQTERVYCPTIVGILAAGRWPVPESKLAADQKDMIKSIHAVAKQFSNAWN